jgi:hypothetical protein
MSGLSALSQRLQLLAGGDVLPAAQVPTFQRAVERGEGIAAALGASGGDRRLVACLTAATPGDALTVLDGLIGPRALHAQHRRQLRASVLPGVLALCTIFFAASVVSMVGLPALGVMGHDLGNAPTAPSWSWLGPVVAATLLVLLDGTVVLELPGSLVAGERRDVDRALLLAAAEVLLRGGVGLPQALEAVAHLTVDRRLAAASVRLAQQLAAGQVPDGGLLLGAESTRLLHALAARGAGAAALQGLAAHGAATNATAVPLAEARVQVTSMMLGGLGLLVTALSLIGTYSAMLGGGR